MRAPGKREKAGNDETRAARREEGTVTVHIPTFLFGG